MESTRDQRFARLRAIAEEISKDREADLSDLASKDMASLINEIQVYQTELEIQNEELRRVQEEIKRARHRFSNLFQMAPAGYLVLDHSSIILDVNRTLCGMVDRDRQHLIGRPVTDLIVPADKPIFYSRYTSFFRKPEGKLLDLRFINTERGDFHARLRGRFLALGEKVDNAGTSRLFIAVTDITGEKQAEYREQHAQKVLRAIRDITQMIASQKDPAQLIHLACSQLTRNMGYYSAWIALLDQPCRQVLAFAASGSDLDFSGLQAQLDRGVFPSCMRTALFDNDIHVVQDPAGECHNCPLHANYADCAAFVQRLEYEGKTIGLLSVAVPRAFTDHPQEKELFSEVVRDLAFALNGIEVARAFRRASGIIEGSPAVAFVWKNEAGWPVEYVSKNCRTLFQRTVQQFLDQEVSYADLIHLLDLVHPDDIPATVKEMQGLAEGKRVFYFENRYRHKNGTYRTLAWSASTPSDEDKLFAVATDITDQRLMEQSLQETKNRFQVIAELASDYFYLLDVEADGRMSVDWISDSFERVTTYSSEEVLSFEQWKSHIHPDDQDGIDKTIADIFRNVPVTSQYRLYTRHDELLWIEEQLRPIWDSDRNRVVKIYGAARDITRQKKAEQALEKALREMKAVYDTAMVGIMVLHSRIIVSVNHRMAEMLGYLPEEMIGRGPEQLHLSHGHFIEFGNKYYWQLAEKAFVQVEYGW